MGFTYTAGTLKTEICSQKTVKKQRFATLTKDEYATLSTLLQERESNNTRRAADMAARTCIDSLSLLLLISLL